MWTHTPIEYNMIFEVLFHVKNSHEFDFKNPFIKIQALRLEESIIVLKFPAAIEVVSK